MRNKICRDRLDQLQSVDLFAGLNASELARIDRLFTTHDIERGRVLITEGTTARQTFIVLSGQAEVTIAGSPVATVGPGEVVGEMAVLDGQPRTATVTAVEAMQVLVVDPRSFRAMLAEPVIARKILDAQVQRLRIADSAHAALASA